ncbi:pyruvate ferredoxin oxidoreductase [Candidatus Falkowbacteria bacterium]|nr:pyruvate ferredoxin oxidoreductase [Candidatus Falkowbacteria bacterium]
MYNKQQILEGSHAIALTIKAIAPAVISAYPITPQTHIVEDLAKFKADGEADFEFLRAESEFAAASIVLGASAAGSRVYTATSSQGLLLMTEVIYNIAGLRLPIVMTCANRAVSAPINIWCDQQDAMTVADAGWIMLFAENNQEAVEQHIMAYKIAEKTRLPVMVNVDGFVLTHTYEPVAISDEKQIKKYLGEYKPKAGQFLDPANPVSMGLLATPAHYMEIRQELHEDLMASAKMINEEYKKYRKIFKITETEAKLPEASGSLASGNGLVEYYGSKNPETILIAAGSVVGTIKDVVDKINTKKSPLPPSTSSGQAPFYKGGNKVGVLKIKTYRPFPAEDILKIIKPAKYVAVIDKAITLGYMGPLAIDVKAAASSASFRAGRLQKIQSFIVGLGGRDITKEMIGRIIKKVKGKNEGVGFVGK